MLAHFAVALDGDPVVARRQPRCPALVEALRAAVIDNKRLDRTNIIEEIGDGFWYDAIALTAIGETRSGFEQCAETNNAKLRRRFPNKFTEHDANNRDVAAERRVLERRELPPIDSNGAAGL